MTVLRHPAKGTKDSASRPRAKCVDNRSVAPSPINRPKRTVRTSAVEKNRKRIRMVKKFASRRARLKAISSDQSIPAEERFAARLKLAELPRNSAPTRVRNRCEVSGRPRAYYRKLGMSRIALRDLASFGQVPGVVKSSW